MKWRKIEYIMLGMILAIMLVATLPRNFIAAPVSAQDGEFTLTILHNNDGESRLIDAGGENTDFGGVARFASLVNKLRTEAVDGSGNTGVILLNSGDNFLAGPEFNASLSKGAPFYDSLALSLIGYDAMAIGNHEFDFGPDVLADFIEGFGGSVPFVSANLDFTGEPRLQALVDEGTIVKSVTVEEEGQQIGIVGATTPRLSFISSPRNVQVDSDVAGMIQTEIDALTANGVNKIIVISHLQDANEDLELAAQLSGVDVMIAGGGDELLANEGDQLVPGDEEPFGSYPLTATNADGVDIPVVTTAGDYKYVGRLVVTFDEGGNVTAIGEDSGLVRVAGGANPDAVEPDPELAAQAVTPVQTFVADMETNVIATSEVALEGRREPGVRTMETNEGNLMADALLWQAQQLAADFGVNSPNVGLQNGGGIRNNTLIPAGPITELDTFSIAPFSNFVAVVENVPPDQFKEIMENALAEVEIAGGRFAQIAGFEMVYDLAGTAQQLDETGSVVTPGTRVQEITLADGTAIVQAGAVVEGAPAVNVATIDFLAQGGDQYPFRDAVFTPLGVSYQSALSNYITQALGGVISAAQYPEGGAGRITQVGAPVAEPAAAAEAEAAAPAAQATMCAQDYTVQADDWLSRIAERYLGDLTAYPQIFEATNAAAAAGGNYATLTDPNIIEVGQILCIPAAGGATTATEQPVAEAEEEAAAPASEEAAVEAETEPPHWGYTGDIGPEFWGNLSEEYDLCATGIQQSPIDITGATPQEGGITFNYQPTLLSNVINNGHTIQVMYDAGSTIEVGGVTYNLIQFHFHVPSEHTEDGTPAAMELHLVHQNADESLAVVGVLMDQGQENPILAQFWDQIPVEESTVSVEGSITIAEALPAGAGYYAYDGSLTTPRCSEGVEWFVFDEHTQVSQEQVDKFVEVVGNNARPTQPLNDRVIGGE
jgi:5'-nucleotidase